MKMILFYKYPKYLSFFALLCKFSSYLSDIVEQKYCLRHVQPEMSRLITAPLSAPKLISISFIFHFCVNRIRNGADRPQRKAESTFCREEKTGIFQVNVKMEHETSFMTDRIKWMDQRFGWPGCGQSFIINWLEKIYFQYFYLQLHLHCFLWD